MKGIKVLCLSMLFSMMSLPSYSMTDPIVTQLNGFSPNTQDNSDLVYFDHIIDGASIVGLGESTHGTSEFFQMKHRLLKHLVEEKGFTVFAMEQDMAISFWLNQYIQKGLGDPKALLADMNRPYNTQEVLDLVMWMHDYNLTAKKKIEIAGFDMQTDQPAATNIRSFLLNSKIKKLKVESQDLLSQTQQDDITAEAISADIQAGKPFKQLIQEVEAYKQTQAAFNVELSQFNSEVISNKELLRKEIGDEVYEYLLQQVTILQQFSVLMPAELADEIPGENGAQNSLNLRDGYMADNILWLKTHHPGAKLVLWAHSGHIQATRAFGLGPSTIANDVWNTMGYHLKKQLKNDYRSITFITEDGTYTALDPSAFQEGSYPLLLPPNNSLEASVDKIGMPMALLNLRDKNHLPNYLWQPTLSRYIGAVAENTFQFAPAGNVSAAFDGIVYFRETTAAKNFTDNKEAIPKSQI